MNKTLLFLFFFCANTLSSQNFQNICSPGTTLYEGPDRYFKAFRQDSVLAVGNSDTLFYSYRAIRDSSGSNFICRDTTNGDALGRKVIKTHDGWFSFFNKMNDTIKLNTQAALNESWRFCSLPDSSAVPEDGYLQATVTAIMMDSVAGTTDMVKVITLQAKDGLNLNIPCIFNQKTIRLSQHYGLSKFYDLYWIPFDTLSLALAGKTSPPIGAQPFTWADVYNFNVGDVFHYAGHHSYGSAAVSWKSISRILGKTVYGNMDSVHYQVEMCKKTWYPQPPPNTATLHDTVIESHDFIQLSGDLTLSLLPDEFSTTGFVARSVKRKYSDYHHRQAQIFDISGYYYYGSDSCYSDPFEAWGPVYWYVPGLGLTNNMYSFADITIEAYSNDLVYFKKGEETWGTPVSTDCSTLVGFEDKDFASEPAIEVFPNPAGSETRVRLVNARQDENFHYGLYNCSGMKVQEGAFAVGQFILHRNNLPAGLYLLIITGRDGRIAGKMKINFI